MDGPTSQDRDLLRRVLEDRHDRHDRRAAGDRERQRVLEADPAFGLAGGQQRLGRRRAVGQDLEVDAGVGVPAVRLGDVEPGVVRVRRPVEGEADRRGPAGVDGRRRRRRGSRTRATAAGAGAARSSGEVGVPPDADRRRRRRARRRGERGSGATDRWWSRRLRRETRNAVSGHGDGVNESTGLLPSPVLAGSGSAGLWRLPHSQRTRRSPEAVFGCARDGTPSDPARRVRATRPMTARRRARHARTSRAMSARVPGGVR